MLRIREEYLNQTSAMGCQPLGVLGEKMGFGGSNKEETDHFWPEQLGFKICFGHRRRLS